MRVLRAALWGTVLATVSCGGGVDVPETDRRSSDGDGTGGAPGGAAATGGREPGGGGAEAPGPEGGAGDEEPYRDPGCPERQRVPGRMDCDPFALLSECGAGERCAPYVRYADDCGSEEFGTACVEAGTGVQGDDCVEQLCAAGHICVTTGEGSQCTQLCRLSSGGGDCPAGLLCQSLDVDGFQICF